MSGSYRTPPGEGLGPLLETIKEVKRRLSELETPTGTSMGSLYAQVQAKLAELEATVNDLVADALVNFYTKTETNALVASPGNISPGNVTGSGALKFPSVYSTILSSDYRAVWVTGVDGQLGHVPSAARFKQDIAGADMDATALLMAAEIVWFRYKAAVEDNVDAPAVLGGIADQFAAAGLGHMVTVDEEGEPFSIEDRPLLYTLLKSHQELVARVEALENP